MSNLYKVSQSKLKTWRRCRRAYHFKYVENLKRKRRPRALMFGTLIHEMIEADANGNDPFDVLEAINLKDQALFATERAEYGEIISDVGLIMGEYFDYWEKHSQMVYIRRKGRSAEHKFEIEIVPGILWNGKIDAVGKTPDGLRWLVEHKSFKRNVPSDDLWRNLQSVSYFRALDIMGWKPVDGTCWDQVWSKAPLRPSLLKNGTMSKKRMDTLPSMIAKAIREYGLDRKDYVEYKKAMEVNRRSWFKRIHTPVNKAVADDVFADFIATAAEMRDLHGTAKERNIDRHCSWCDFEPLCRAQMQGLDHEYVQEREYEKNNRPPENDPAELITYDEL